jgi:hypothetical protein
MKMKVKVKMKMKVKVKVKGEERHSRLASVRGGGVRGRLRLSGLRGH